MRRRESGSLAAMRPPSWHPTPEVVAAANVTAAAIDLGCDGYEELHRNYPSRLSLYTMRLALNDSLNRNRDATEEPVFFPSLPSSVMRNAVTLPVPPPPPAPGPCESTM